MAGELQAGLGLLSGLLALPKTWEDERNRALFQNQLLQQLATPPPGSPEAAAPQAPIAQLPVPGHFPGTQVPYLGGLLRGIGSVGQGLNLALGGQPPQTFDPQLLGMMLMQGRFNQQIGEKKAEFGQREEDVKARLLETQQQHEWQRSFQEQQAEANKQNREAILALKEQGKDPTNLLQLYEQDPQKAAQYADFLRTHPGVPKGEYGAWQSEHPGGTLEDFWKAKAAAAVDKAGALAKAKAAALTSPTRTMIEAAPSVLDLVGKVEDSLSKIQAGPLASRWQQFVTGQIGAPDPEFVTYKTNADLLSTLLLRMHVGARGGQLLLGQFKDMLATGIQSPENMRAALEAIRDYATDLQARGTAAGVGVSGAPGPSGAAPAPGATPGQGPQNMSPPSGSAGLPIQRGVPSNQDPLRRALGMPGY